ncbi:hypothetical protein B0H13DRAFT_2329920 [Mycena leptocephala]|nr:hypothetical protein B0H13DRAFT_2329920 [Mycena leptocephala]
MSNPPESVINQTLGALVLGLYIQQALFGVICLQTRRYYHRFSDRDCKLYQGLVGTLLVLNFLEEAMNVHVLYRTTVTHYDFAFFDRQTWTMWSEPGVTALVGFIAQLFFTERCWRTTNNSRPVLALLALLLLLSFGSGVAVSVSFFQVKLFSELAKIPIPITFWLVSTALTDLTIAGTLSFSLLRRTHREGVIGFKRTSDTVVSKRTEDVVSKLIRLSMETSFATAIIAIVNLILVRSHYFVMMKTAYHLLPQFCICRVYTITVLVTLLERDAMRQELDAQTVYNCDSLFSFVRSAKMRGARDCDRNTNNCPVEVKMTTQVERDVRDGSITNPDSEPKRISSDAKLMEWSSAV